jgi:hypothetical protein
MLTHGGFRLNVVLCVFLQVALFLESGRWLASVARLRGQAVMTGVLMVLLTLCYWQFFYHADADPKNRDIYWLSSLGILGNHFGAVLASLWGLALIAGALRSGAWGAAARGLGLAALILATGWSDMLYLIWFCAPDIVCLLCLIGFAKGLRLRSASLAIVVAAVGWKVYSLQIRFNTLLDHYHDPDADVREMAGRSFDYLWALLFDSERKDALHAAIFAGAASLLAAYALIRLALAFRRREPDASFVIRALIAGYLAAAPVVCVAVGCFAGMFHDLGLPRYTLPVVFMTLIGLAFAAAEAMDGREMRLPSWARSVFHAAIVPLCLFLATRDYSARIPPPPDLSCLPGDRPLAGLAEYWQARPLRLFGGERLQIEPLTVDAMPFWWISNRFWFTHRRTPPDGMPLYSFIDMRRLDPDTVERRYGKPSAIVKCDTVDIWFYDDAEALTRRFMQLYIYSAAAVEP